MTALVGLRRRDDGRQGDRALAGGRGARHRVAAATRSRRRRPGWAEQDPEDWWDAAQAALGEVAEGRDVAGIGLSGQMHGLVALDGGDRVIRPAILWNDQRTAAECAEIESRIGPSGSSS